MATIVILKNFEKPICNDHYIYFYEQNKLTIICMLKRSSIISLDFVYTHDKLRNQVSW